VSYQLCGVEHPAHDAGECGAIIQGHGCLHRWEACAAQAALLVVVPARAGACQLKSQAKGWRAARASNQPARGEEAHVAQQK